MKNVLCTGGVGFIGSHLVKELVFRGCKVTVLDDLSVGSKDLLWATAHPFVLRTEDITTFDYDLLNWEKIDTVFHLAAVSRIQQSWDDPERCERVNGHGTALVLEAAGRWNANVVFASTSCCQGDCELNPYAKSKRYGERLCNEYRQGSGLKVTVARLFNVYGPGEHGTGPAATLVGKFLHAHRSGTPFTINGDGYQRRDFVHVADAVSALILLAESNTGRDPDPYDVGTGFTHSVFEVLDMFRPDGGTADQTVRGDRYKGELESTRANPERLFALGWCPKNRLEDYVRSVL